MCICAWVHYYKEVQRLYTLASYDEAKIHFPPRIFSFSLGTCEQELVLGPIFIFFPSGASTLRKGSTLINCTLNRFSWASDDGLKASFFHGFSIFSSWNLQAVTWLLLISLSIYIFFFPVEPPPYLDTNDFTCVNRTGVPLIWLPLEYDNISTKFPRYGGYFITRANTCWTTLTESFLKSW